MSLYCALYILRWLVDFVFLAYKYLVISDPHFEASPFVIVFSLPMLGFRAFQAYTFPCTDMRTAQVIVGSELLLQTYCGDRAIVNGVPLNVFPVYVAMVSGLSFRRLCTLLFSC